MTAKKDIKHWKLPLMHGADLGEFRDIPGTGGTYKVSRDGVVVSQCYRGLPDGYWLVLGQRKTTNSKRYRRLEIIFANGRGKKSCMLSRLILEAWVGPAPSDSHLAAHKNGIIADDKLDNLKWATAIDVKHGSIARGTWAHGETLSKHDKSQVEAARKVVVEYGVPVNLLAEALGMEQTRVREWIVKTWDTEKWDGLENPLTADG